MVLAVVDLQKIRCEKAPPNVHMILLLIILGMVLDTMAEGRLESEVALTCVVKKHQPVFI
ncbi:hypothetical protein BCR43DRAFT_496703 [Syncephalastrum racemosum]|uniref:Uncharacterized protein n=1 Tax=Syncephalastrum racemosum TaxID=13706 RepID=A0A1X2H4G5_SYNRA|nr:hypothetical protein BCR43DRAFT_496703 [Syncephalastrum racemosum]